VSHSILTLPTCADFDYYHNIKKTFESDKTGKLTNTFMLVKAADCLLPRLAVEQIPRLTDKDHCKYSVNPFLKSGVNSDF
jgi:hypothetical protein